MNNKLIKPITYVVTSILTFIFLALDYFKVVAIYNKKSESEGISGYDYISEKFKGADAEILKKVASLALVGVILAAVVLLLVAVAKLLPTFGVKIDILEKQDALVEKVGSTASLLLTVLNVCAFMMTFGFGLLNTESVFGITITMTTAIGAYLLIILSLVPYIVNKVGIKKEAAPAPQQDTPNQQF